MKIAALIGSMLLLVIPVSASGQQDGEATGDLLLLAATRTATMGKELDDAASRKYRVLSAAGGVGFNEVIVVLQPSGGGYQYRLIATERTSTLLNELNAAGRDGYRILPRTVTTKRNPSPFNANDYELFVILQKSPDVATPVQYQVLATSRTGTLQNELKEAQAQGWNLITLLVRGEVLALMERPVK